MKKSVIFSLFVCASLPLLAQEIPCLDKLTRYQSESTAHFQLAIKNYLWKADTKKMSSDLSREAFLYFLKDQLHCADSEITSTTMPTCSELMSGKPDSLACYFETNLGYVMTTKDKLENINILFSSWK